MGNKYASGKNSPALCDRCGQRYRLPQLKELVVRARKTNIMVCPECWEADHPQNLQGMFPVNDPQALRNPRPDSSYGASGPYSSRATQWGWAPVGGGYADTLAPNNLVARAAVGTVTINAL